MTRADHDEFIRCIHAIEKLTLRFFSKEDGRVLTRTCAPFDYGPSRTAKDKSDRYHFWDYDSDTRRHTLSLLPDQIQSIKGLGERFSPGDIVKWDVSKTPWFIERNWGAYS